MSASRVTVDRALFRDLSRSVDAAVTRDARPVVARLADAIGNASGPPAYRRVYAALARGVELRPVPNQPPSITIGGRGSFSGGGTISSLVGPYEYGSPRGDTRRAPRRTRGRSRARRGSQFPPRRSGGWWVGPTVESESGRLADGFATLIDTAIDRATRSGGL